ncbi:MAG: DUF3795 domain-containing protein [Candidatus Lokiarchaeota archaeon]|nr:DUF3795 domain-containing protein [Candidatus Lokiarchaeota archaeon]
MEGKKVQKNNANQRQHPTLGCCGIDCGLCPQHHGRGQSRCPGCGGPDFPLKHPSCGILTCCVKKKGLETCGDCQEFPCQRLSGWDAGDSFVSHKNSLANLALVKGDGIDGYLAQQQQRLRVLEHFLGHYDDGRSKSFYCLASTLLSIPALGVARKEADEKTTGVGTDPADQKAKARVLHDILNSHAGRERVDLRLRRKAG